MVCVSGLWPGREFAVGAILGEERELEARDLDEVDGHVLVRRTRVGRGA